MIWPWSPYLTSLPTIWLTTRSSTSGIWSRMSSFMRLNCCVIVTKSVSVISCFDPAKCAFHFIWSAVITS
ncbi:hypothetical protein KC354_g87 [Hortaea werneckii]|nr:hypothetical protein KC354_g87 [Hortaea werneckii]